jgi:anti-anti-sigma regulatory factor
LSDPLPDFVDFREMAASARSSSNPTQGALVIHVRQKPEASRVELQFHGVLDARGAKELTMAAAMQPAGLHLVIDISRASLVHDLALGILVDGLARPHSVRGASRHHARLVVCLGGLVDEGPRPGDHAAHAADTG